MSSEKFSHIKKKKLEQIYGIANECGLIRESIDYEVNKADRMPYWNHPETSRWFRYNEESETIDVTKLNPDRWAISSGYSIQLPKNLGSLRAFFIRMIYLKEDIVFNENDFIKNKRKKEKYFYSKI